MLSLRTANKQIIGSLKASFWGAFAGAYNLLLKTSTKRKWGVTMVTKEEFKENLLALMDVIKLNN